MKVIHLIECLSRRAGGMFETVPGLTKAVSQLPDTRLAVLGPQDEFFDQDRPKWSVPVSGFPVAKRLPRKLRYTPGMLANALAENADVAVCHGIWPYHNWVAAEWARRTGRPCVISPHGMIDSVDLRKSRLFKRIMRHLYVNRLFEGAACVRAISESEARSVRLFGAKAPICLVPNGIWLPESSQCGPPPWKDSVPAQKRVLFYLGRLNPKKNLPSLLTAWARVSPNNPQWHLVIGGWDQSGHERELKEQAARLSIRDSVFFAGPLFLESKRAAFCHADAFVIPSTSEGMPTAVLEAWSYELPVLMTPECNLPEGLASGAAIRIETDAVSIERGIRDLLAMSSDSTELLARRGLALVNEEFCWPRIAAQMMEVYQWILGKGPRPKCVMDDDVQAVQ